MSMSPPSQRSATNNWQNKQKSHRNHRNQTISFGFIVIKQNYEIDPVKKMKRIIRQLNLNHRKQPSYTQVQINNLSHRYFQEKIKWADGLDSTRGYQYSLRLHSSEKQTINAILAFVVFKNSCADEVTPQKARSQWLHTC